MLMKHRCGAQQIHRLFLVTLAVLIAAVFGLLAGYTAFSPPQPLHPELIISSHRGLLLPESAERFVFLSCSVLAPVLAFLLVFITRDTVCTDGPVRPGLYSSVPATMIAALFFLPFVNSEFVATIIGRFGEIEPRTYPAVIAGSAVAAVWCLLYVRMPVRSGSGLRYGGLLPWAFFLAAMTLQLLSWRLVGISSVTRVPIWFDSADPLFYAISQVAAGRTLLAELPSQYGLFPEMLAPLFRLTGLSVLSVSSCFALMQVVSMAALFYLLSRLVKSRVLLTVTGLALVALTFETVLHYVHNDDCYFQYWPIRFFWPALSLLVLYGFAKRMTLGRSAVVSLIGGISLLWNIDTGLFVVLAYGALLVVRAIIAVVRHPEPACQGHPCVWPAATYFRALLLHGAIVAAVAAAFFGLLSWKADDPIDISLLFRYQKIFYGTGFMMLPLPRLPDPWMAVLGVYLLGILTSLAVWRRNRGRVRHDVMFYLSMLGAGLFVYYQGRSHVLNLVSVCWPAIVLTALLADEFLRLVRAGGVPRIQLLLPGAGIALLVIAGVGFLGHVPRFVAEAGREHFGPVVVKDPLVADELEFIRRSAGFQQKCLILAKRQGIYYTETGFISPLKGPGLAESILAADRKNMSDAILDGSIPCIFLGIGPDSDAGADIPYDAILSRYSVVGVNAIQTLLMLKPAPQ